MRVSIADTIQVSGFKKTTGGYLVADARIARTGLYTYTGEDLGRPELERVIVYRPESSVFDTKAMESFAHKPITNDHPVEDVTAENWKTHAVGYSGDLVARDGDYVKVPMMVADSSTIRDIETGKKELSAGYGANIEFQDGVTPEGEKYDAVMKDIRGNHIAIVMKGRAGSECRIGDSFSTPKKEPASMVDQTRAVLHDGVTYQLSDQGAQLLERIQGQLRDARTAVSAKDGEIAAMRATHTAEISAKDGAIAALESNHTAAITAKDGEIAAVKALVPDVNALDAAIETRLGLVATVRRSLGDSFDHKGKTDADLRRLFVAKRLGDSVVDGKAPEWIAAAFDTLSLADKNTTTPTANPLRDALSAGVTPVIPLNDAAVADSAYEAMLERQRNAWRAPSSKDAH